MLFNSLHYLVFLPVVVALYFAIPQRWRWLLLLIASYYFYMCWKAEYAILMVISTSVAYISALRIDHTQDAKQKKLILWICLAILLGILFAFKYFNFVNASGRAVGFRALCGRRFNRDRTRNISRIIAAMTRSTFRMNLDAPATRL